MFINTDPQSFNHKLCFSKPHCGVKKSKPVCCFDFYMPLKRYWSFRDSAWDAKPAQEHLNIIRHNYTKSCKLTKRTLRRDQKTLYGATDEPCNTLQSALAGLAARILLQPLGFAYRINTCLRLPYTQLTNSCPKELLWQPFSVTVIETRVTLM